MSDEKLDEKSAIAPVVETEQKPKKKKMLTVEDILIQFKRYDRSGESASSYSQLMLALDNFSRWEEDPRAQFIKKFYMCAHELDAKCADLVEKLVNLPIESIPLSEVEFYMNLLRQVAMNHVAHTEIILSKLVNDFMPHAFLPQPEAQENGEEVEGRSTWEFVISAEDQERIYGAVHNAIQQILIAIPTASRMLVKCVQIRSPHHTQNTVKYIHFFRNIVCMMEYVTVDSRPYLWDFLLSQLSIMDSILSVDLQGAQNQFAVRKSIFAVEETEVESMEVDEKEPVDVFLAELFKKLDICILYTIGWISRFYTPIMNSSNAEHLSWLPPLTREAKQQTDLFAQFQPAFDRVLAQDIKSVPLIWMYMTSQDENFLTRILSSLWMIVTRPSQTPNEWKRSHMAACYLAGFLARSNSVTLEVVMKWFGEMTNWCTRYVNEVAGGLSLNSVGTLRHGTFYAVCQAVFLAFCFRYKQIVEADDLGTVQKWGLGHIVHSYLCPLMYINRPVALCFSAISRSLQLVYCNHLLSHIEESERPFESTFPFDTCFLPMCGEFLSGCLQKFSPMQNDITLISRELTRGSQYNANLKTESADDGAADDEDAFDFMYEDDDDIADVIHVSGGKSLPMSIPPRSQTFTQYSQSPGLRTMEFV